jgi:hypothetical protein
VAGFASTLMNLEIRGAKAVGESQADSTIQEAATKHEKILSSVVHESLLGYEA